MVRFPTRREAIDYAPHVEQHVSYGSKNEATRTRPNRVAQGQVKRESDRELFMTNNSLDDLLESYRTRSNSSSGSSPSLETMKIVRGLPKLEIAA